MRIVTSNGSNQFFIAPLSAELVKRGCLEAMITSGWPTPLTAAIARPFAGNRAVGRFFARREDIPLEKLRITNFSEFLFQVSIRFRRIPGYAHEHVSLLAFAWYSRYASRVVARLSPDIYHFRACYGLRSVNIARKLGAISICDHSIAHPGVLQYMVENAGKWPAEPERRPASPLQRLMWRDLHNADVVLVNSDFVKRTCSFSGIDPDRIHVIYLGIDEKFRTSIPDFDYDQVARRKGQAMLFAGGLQRRKGAITLAKAYLSLEKPPAFNLIVGVDQELGQIKEVAEFLKHPQVRLQQFLPRAELAQRMAQSPVFVFPSYCEGSARVIFEAMACGCFVITTPNSGSIVKDGEHGFVVPCGDATALAHAISRAYDNPELVAAVGWRNAKLVRENFTQAHYGLNVMAFYSNILGS